MFERAPRSGYDATSAVWNIAYDAGLGLGALAFGLVASHTGYPIAFALGGAFVLAALAPLRPLRAMRTDRTEDKVDASAPHQAGSTP
jgi:predicted MFS family arabinose efflux permease